MTVWTHRAHDFSGTTALVTGASSGIGAAFATALAEGGADLLLLARRGDVLGAKAAELAERYGVKTEALVVDLANQVELAQLCSSLEGRRVDLLVNNAGAGSHGRFIALNPEREHSLVELNCAAVVALSAACLPGMVTRGTGGLINVASIVAYQPMPTMATYGATKAFLLSFSVALATECRGTGVRVLVSCPGTTATEFGSSSGDEHFTRRYLSRARSPEFVVERTLEAYAAGRTVVVPGSMNLLFSLLGRYAPLPLASLVVERVLDSA